MPGGLIMVRQFKKIVEQAQKEASYWKFAAWTLPFVALGLLVLEYWIGSTKWFEITLLSITLIFFTVSVFWWWWAIHKIMIILEGMNRTSDNFEEIKQQLEDTKKSFQETFGDR